MRTARGSIASAWRLGLGACRLVLTPLLGRKSPRLISFDIFATILERVTDEHQAARLTAVELCRRARALGLSVPDDPYLFRCEVEKRLHQERRAQGLGTELSTRELLAAMLATLGAGPWGKALSEEMAAKELAWEMHCTRPHAAGVALLTRYREAGARIIAVSDTRYTGTEIEALLAHHHIAGISKVYASADHGVSKFHGGLFDIVIRLEEVAPGEILHIGDDLFSDCLSAAHRGMRVRKRPRPNPPGLLPAAPAVAEDEDPAYKLGHQLLGPVVAGFVELLLAEARCQGVEHLAFLARDGYLPYKVAQILGAEPALISPGLSYLHLSRRSVSSLFVDFTTLAEDSAAAAQLVEEMRHLRGDLNLVHRLRDYFALPEALVSREAERLGIREGTPTELLALLTDAQAAASIQEELAPRRELLEAYLSQANLLASETALVDVGWRGSIHTQLCRLASARGQPTPRAYYIGYETESPSLSGSLTVGLISDSRRNRSPLEMAAFHAMPVLEACLKAAHGMAAGFGRDECGQVVPLHVETGAARAAEQGVEPLKDQVQKGALKYARWYAEAYPLGHGDALALRRRLQGLLFRLAFFPVAWQVALGRQLFHTEPTDDHAATPLILDSVSGIWRGLRSPWKGGYAMATVGRPAALLYLLAEGTMGYVPRQWKHRLRGWLLGRKA